MYRAVGMNPGRKPEQSRASTHRRAAEAQEPLESVLELQRTAGNAAMARVLQRDPADPTIKRGSRGAAVADGLRRIQARLAHDLGTLPVPTRYNDAAEIQIRFFQLGRGLATDGELGPSTWKKLKDEENPPAQGGGFPILFPPIPDIFGRDRW
jgi:peptidoglycan hydrolase-like protein with peptidoglycan-binding domain